MRVNIEDDLWTSSRLSKLARTVRMDEDRALGKLVNFYRLTQRAGVSVETFDRICTVTVIAFDSDEEAAAFLRAMISAQLADRLDDDRVLIRGNEKHVERIAELYERSVRGGKSRAAKARREPTGSYEKTSMISQAEDQAESRQNPALLAPSSQLPALACKQASKIALAQIEGQGDPQADPGSLATYQLQAIPVEDAKHAWDSWADELTKIRNVPMPPIPSPRDLHAFRFVVLWAGDKRIAAQIARAWVHCKDPKGYFERQGWAPWLLAEERNFAEARAMAAKMLARSQRESVA